jgi:hypothetical protein
MEFIFSVFFEIIGYFVIGLIEFFIELKIAQPVQTFIEKSRYKKMLFQKEDTLFLTILKSLLLLCAIFLPIVTTIYLVYFFGLFRSF